MKTLAELLTSRSSGKIPANLLDARKVDHDLIVGAWKRLIYTPGRPEGTVDRNSYTICVLAFADGSVVEVSTKKSFTELITRMGSIVDLYADTRVERVFSGSPWTTESIRVRFERFPEHNLFVAFPTFSPQQVITLVDRGVLMPAGITRHVVYRRKLNVNLPLEYLKIIPIEQANDKL